MYKTELLEDTSDSCQVQEITEIYTHTQVMNITHF